MSTATLRLGQQSRDIQPGAVALRAAQVDQQRTQDGDYDILQSLSGNGVALFVRWAQPARVCVPVSQDILRTASERLLQIVGGGLDGIVVLLSSPPDGVQDVAPIVVGGDDYIVSVVF